MMIPNCRGCEEEYGCAFEYAESEGWHVATMKDNEFQDKGHLNLVMVDDEGRIMLSKLLLED